MQTLVHKNSKLELDPLVMVMMMMLVGGGGNGGDW